jgi:YebC/PmpR family DNA-binding regulatory protein
MSGHNKWSKIKHKKAVTDAQRSRMFSKHSRLITVEAQRANGNRTSPSLVAAIERAKRDAMPKDNIERAISKGTAVGGNQLQTVLFEAYGPGGTALLITAITDNNNRTNQLIKHTLSKAGYQLAAPGSASWAFYKDGEQYRPITPTTLSDNDGEALATLIEQLADLDDVQDIFTTTDTVE